jgi:elongation factor Ts
VDINLIKELRDRTSIGMSDCKKALEQSGGDIEAAIDLLKTWGELKGKEKSNKIATEGKIGIFGNNSGSVVGIFEVNCQTDFVANSCEFLDLMSSLDKMSGFSEETFEKKRQELVAKTGENIVLRRKEIYECARNSSIRWYQHQGNRLGVLLEVYADRLTDEVVDFADECAMQVAAMSPLVVSKDDIPGEMLVRQRSIFEAQLTEENKPKQAWQKIIEGKFAKWRKDVVLLEQESIKIQGQTIDQLRVDLEKRMSTKININRFVRYELGQGLEKKQENLADEVAKLTGIKN